MASPPPLFLQLLISFSFLFFQILTTSSTDLCNPKDKSTLLKIKNQLNPKARYFSNWNPSTDCCKKWNGITCSDDGRVNLLAITGDDSVIGNIPPVIGDLPSLTNLQFFSLPNLTGSIPLEMSRLTSLTFLLLMHTSLTGPIPAFLGQLSKLEKLELASNHFTGTIPPSLSLLTHITDIDLNFNHLTGSIPESFGAFKTGLDFQAVNNSLSGLIPRSLGQANFTTFHVSGNQLTGDASFLLNGRKKALESIVLRGNMFKFDFTNVDLPHGLKLIDISYNMIFGSLPKMLGKLPLSFIDVSYNQLCGPIPMGGRLKQFWSIRFEHNKCLCGLPLPPCK